MEKKTLNINFKIKIIILQEKSTLPPQFSPPGTWPEGQGLSKTGQPAIIFNFKILN